MRARTLATVFVFALLGTAAAFAGGFALGGSAATSDSDAARDRAAAKQRALRRGRDRNERTLDEVRVTAGGAAARRGRAAGVVAGRAAGEREIAARGAGPTELDLPLLPSDAYDAPPQGFTVRPGKILLTNHGGAENITWSAWGDTAAGTGTLTGSDCEPNCAEGKPTRDPVTLTATDPQFTAQGKRFFSKLVVAPQGKPSSTYRINPDGAPDVE